MSSSTYSDNVVKISQRHAKSCTECIRRKTRCNKQLPCDQCTKRGVTSLCRLEAQYRTETFPCTIAPGYASSIPGWAHDVLAQVAGLRARVAALEGRDEDRPAKGHADPEDPHQSCPDVSISLRMSPVDLAVDLPLKAAPQSLGDPIGDDSGPGGGAWGGKGKMDSHHTSNPVEDAATTLEYFALGLDRRLGDEQNTGIIHPDTSSGSRSGRRRIRQDRRSHICSTPAYPDTPESIKDALLPKSIVDRILSFAETDVLWQHCCIFFAQFREEVEDIWRTFEEEQSRLRDGWSRIEPTWIALLYVVMGIAVHQMSEADAVASGLSEADRLVLPNALISAAEDALGHGNFLSNPTIWTVQTIAILTLCGHNVCDSDLLASLLAVGIRMAQIFGLHSLGRRVKALYVEDSGVSASASTVIEIELGKRLWWALVQEDWFGIPFCGVWTIHPDHFDTPLPLNCDDAELSAGRRTTRPDTQLSVAFKQRFSSQMAGIVRQVFHDLRHASESKDAVIAVDHAVSRIQDLLGRLPQALRAGSSSDPDTPRYSSAMRHYIQVSAQHKLLVINRALLAHGVSRHEQGKAQKACIRHAQAIVEEIGRGQLNADTMQSLWTIPYHGLAAAVVLVLDLIAICRTSGVTSNFARIRRTEVVRARTALCRLSPTSRIARRGLRVISDLLRHADETGRGKKRNSDGQILHFVQDIDVPPNEAFEDDADESSEVGDRVPDAFSQVITSFHGRLAQVREVGGTRSGETSLSASSPVAHGAVPESAMPVGSEPALSPGRIEPVSPDWAWMGDFTLSQEETDELLLSLQTSIPDVGRLFDGSIGSFG